MKKYNLILKAEIPTSFRTKKAADSVDIDVSKKLTHEINIQADIETDYKVGLILGSSGSGKTTLAKKIFGDSIFDFHVDESQNILDQFDKSFDYDSIVNLITGVGLSSVPCWLKPVNCLSNGQKARAEIALKLSKKEDTIIIDEWTSVVDRNAAKVMSHAIQKYCRQHNKKIILLSCHFDVVEWINPDWVIDCNLQKFEDRRLLCQSFRRSEKIQFDIREVKKETWKYFSKYHYLSEKLPAGLIETYGLFLGENQIGFQCFANYTPHSDKKKKKIMHSNRTVIHPDYVGFGLGLKLINSTSKIMKNKGYDVWAKYSSTPIYKSMIKYKDQWQLKKISRNLKVMVGKIDRQNGYREKVKTYSFKYIGQ